MDKSLIENEFTLFITDLLNSELYQSLCEKIYGYPYKLMNMMNSEDIKYIINELKVIKPKSVLDVGCGTGGFIELLNENLKCSYTGIEITEHIVGMLVKRNQKENIKYRLGSVNNLKSINNCQFDVIFLIDSIYFCEDMEKGIIDLYNHLADNGNMYIYYSEYKWVTNNNNFKSADTNCIGMILKKMGYVYSSSDITEHEINNWECTLKVCSQMEQNTICKKDKEIIKGRIDEAAYALTGLHKGEGKRYIYKIEKNSL